MPWPVENNIAPAEAVVRMMFGSMLESLRGIFFREIDFFGFRQSCA